jgi:hypothetical protein
MTNDERIISELGNEIRSILLWTDELKEKAEKNNLSDVRLTDKIKAGINDIQTAAFSFASLLTDVECALEENEPLTEILDLE